jgi:hypothetical protein
MMCQSTYLGLVWSLVMVAKVTVLLNSVGSVSLGENLFPKPLTGQHESQPLPVRGQVCTQPACCHPSGPQRAMLPPAFLWALALADPSVWRILTPFCFINPGSTTLTSPSGLCSLDCPHRLVSLVLASLLVDDYTLIKAITLLSLISFTRLHTLVEQRDHVWLWLSSYLWDTDRPWQIVGP